VPALNERAYDDESADSEDKADREFDEIPEPEPFERGGRGTGMGRGDTGVMGGSEEKG